jgi:primosomal protein N' (replication factor Y)
MSIVRVALDLPLPRLFDYLAPDATAEDIGYRASVPFGKGSKTGVIVGWSANSDQPVEKLKAATTILRDMPRLPTGWLAMCEFCARYYQAPLGEVMSLALPPMLRRGKLPRVTRAKKGDGAVPAVSPAPALCVPAGTFRLPRLLSAQHAAVERITGAADFQTFLLHGVTGSGKTEVYQRSIAAVLAQGEQALMLVPEIALTPQLEGRVRARFAQAHIVVANSSVGDAARARVSGGAARASGYRARHAAGGVHAAAASAPHHRG